jgi:outer membrane receptor for ferrienterochelin and colicin
MTFYLTKSRYILLVFLVLYFSSLISAQQYTISGYVTDAKTGETLLSAYVYIEGSHTGTATNNYGFYTLTLPKNELITLVFSYVGYQDQKHDIVLDKSLTMNIQLQATITLGEVVITAEQSRRIQNQTQMSVIDVPIAQIKQIPALLGETDVFKVLQLLPGVQSGGEGQSGLYVRGGSPDQNLILLDGVPVYNASHLFGFFSVFNTDAIKDVRLIKGGFPARYGSRLSSVIDITMKEGNTRELKGTTSIGLVASRFTLEGPIGKDERTSFIVSARRTYIDILAQPLIRAGFRSEGASGTTGYYFYDLNGKINHKISDRDRLYFSIYSGRDKFYLRARDKVDFGNIEEDYFRAGLGWGNITSAMRWNRAWTPKLFSNTTLIYSGYGLNTLNEFGQKYRNSTDEELVSLHYDAGIRDWGIKTDFDFAPNPDHHIKFGVALTHHSFYPGNFTLQNIDTRRNLNLRNVLGQDSIRSIELNLYIEDDWVVSDKLKINYGLHFAGLAVQKSFYPSIQPRISSRYLLNTSSAIKLSFATMQQFVHLLANEGIGLPTDLWVPSTDRVKPQSSWQVALGYSKSLSDGYELSVESYYKDMKNVISFSEGEGIFSITDWQDRVTQGQGTAYGAEIFLQRKKGKFTGWAGYTLSWTNRRFDDINQGRWFPFRYDRRHDISLVGMYQFNENIDISATWVYGTGNAITLADSRAYGHSLPYSYWSQEFQFYENRNDFRMNAYHRLDLGINFKKQKEKYERIWSFGVYNAYSRNNPFFIYLRESGSFNPISGEYESKAQLRQVSLFPLIPYLNWTANF